MILIPIKKAPEYPNSGAFLQMFSSLFKKRHLHGFSLSVGFQTVVVNTG